MLDIPKKILFGAGCAYYFYNYQDVPGVLPMMLLGNIVYNSFFSEEALEEAVVPESTTEYEYSAVNFLTAFSLGTSFLMYNTSFLRPFAGFWLGELITSLGQSISDEVKENKNKIS